MGNDGKLLIIIHVNKKSKHKQEMARYIFCEFDFCETSDIETFWFHNIYK